jgi:hypothetical protein
LTQLNKSSELGLKQFSKFLNEKKKKKFCSFQIRWDLSENYRRDQIL